MCDQFRLILKKLEITLIALFAPEKIFRAVWSANGTSSPVRHGTYGR